MGKSNTGDDTVALQCQAGAFFFCAQHQALQVQDGGVQGVLDSSREVGANELGVPSRNVYFALLCVCIVLKITFSICKCYT
jgi:hypothetical protein